MGFLGPDSQRYQGASRAGVGWGDGGLSWGGATGLQGHCERDRFSSHTHNDCVTGDRKGTASGPGEFSRTDQNAREGGAARAADGVRDTGTLSGLFRLHLIAFTPEVNPEPNPQPSSTSTFPLCLPLPLGVFPPQAFVHHLVPFPVYTLVLVSLSHFFLSTPAAISKPSVFVLSCGHQHSEKRCFEVAILL